MKPNYIICIFIVYIKYVYTLKFVPHPEAAMSFVSKVRRHGYPLESYKITTEDDYILTIYRLPHGIHRYNGTKRSPVLLLHGMGAAPSYYIAMGKYRSLPYYLADRGFDVWFLNARGLAESRGHKQYNSNRDRKYWDFGFHDIAVHDITANIDFIIAKTNQKPFVIGHSQGNTCFFVLCTEKPEYNDKIKMGMVYGPSIFIQHMDIPFAYFFIYMVDVIEAVYNFFGFYEALPFGTGIFNLFQSVVRLLCSERTYFLQVCMNVLSIIGTHESKLLEQDTVPIIFGDLQRISSQQILHYMQIVKSGIFRQYDHGSRMNLKIYKRRSPPEYDLRKITAPVAIFYAEKDEVITLKGAIQAIETLPNVIYHAKVPYKFFNHIDFLFGSNVSTLVYEPTVQIFRAFDEGHFTANSTFI